MKQKVCVVGSLNMDLIVRVENFPQPGETIRGHAFDMLPGGKGGNQAVALARLGADVTMVGAVGDDVFAEQYRQVFAAEGIGTDSLLVLAGTPTGTALIQVDGDGQNTICIVAGANEQVTAQVVTSQRHVIEAASALLLQLEIPLSSVLCAARLAQAEKVPVILDPAPACELPEELYQLVDYITPNETEAAFLTNEDTTTDAGIESAARVLRQRGVACVIIKAGERGSFVLDEQGFRSCPGFKVDVVDTVAAGDSFNAGFTQALLSGKKVDDAIIYANAVAALAVTKAGAQSAMPTMAEVNQLLAVQKSL